MLARKKLGKVSKIGVITDTETSSLVRAKLLHADSCFKLAIAFQLFVKL